MNNKITIRVLKSADFTILNKLFGLGTIYNKPPERWATYLAETNAKKRLAVVAEVSGEVVGYCTLKFYSQYSPFRESDTPEVSDLGVAEAFRKRGVGRELVVYLEKIAQQKGSRQIGIGFGLYGDYGPAQRLYVKMGYIPDGHGVTYNYEKITPGKEYKVDDDLILWFTKEL